LATTTPTDRFGDIGLEDLHLGELLVPMGGQPYLPQGAFLGQNDLGVEHGPRRCFGRISSAWKPNKQLPPLVLRAKGSDAMWIRAP